LSVPNGSTLTARIISSPARYFRVGWCAGERRGRGSLLSLADRCRRPVIIGYSRRTTGRERTWLLPKERGRRNGPDAHPSTASSRWLSSWESTTRRRPSAGAGDSCRQLMPSSTADQPGWPRPSRNGRLRPRQPNDSDLSCLAAGAGDDPRLPRRIRMCRRLPGGRGRHHRALAPSRRHGVAGEWGSTSTSSCGKWPGTSSRRVRFPQIGTGD
jgi:hypothetical protein